MKYPLLPYSQLVFDMQKTNPDVYTSRSVLRLHKDKVDVKRLHEAIEKAVRNHPVSQMQVDENGMQQFAPQADVMHGQYHAVDFVDKGAYVDVYIRNNRILGDARSDMIITEDVARAYEGLELQSDGYIHYLQQMEETKRSPRYAADKQWLESEYGNMVYPVHPKPDFPIHTTEVPLENMYQEDYSDIKESFADFAVKNLLSLTAFFSLASALAMMEYNHCVGAALTWAYDGRETEMEQHIYGSLHRDIPFMLKMNSDGVNSRGDLILETRRQFRKGIAHSSYPFTLKKPHTEIWNYALNVLVQPTKQAHVPIVPFAFEDITPKEDMHIAYSLLDVEIYDAEQLVINYRYSATHYKEESIKKFAALVRKYAEWLLEE